MSRDITYVANASGRPPHVYCSSDLLTLEDIELTTQSKRGIKAGISKLEAGLSSSEEMKLAMRRDSRIRYVRIPTDDFGEILGEGRIYVTVFVENGSDPDYWLNISQNFQIPAGRSFIVTAQRDIKFQKLGANIWEDGLGNNHRK